MKRKRALRRAGLAVVVAVAIAGAVAERADSRQAAQSGEAERLALAAPLAAPDFSALLERSEPEPAATAPPETDSVAVRSAIERENALLLEAYRSGDAATLAARYTEDASLVSPGNVTVRGRDRIAAWFQAQREAGLGDLSLHTANVVRVGDLAYETGTWGSRADVRAGSRASLGRDSGRYYAIWKALPDGRWGCQVGIWNTDTEGPLPR